MLAALLEVVLPVFAVVGAGFVYAGSRRFPVAEVTDLIIHLTGACLVFDALSGAERFGLDAARVPVSAASVFFLTLALAALARRAVPSLRVLPAGAVLLPAAFMNAGNMGLPVAELALGRPGFETATLVFVTMIFLMYSVGVGVIAGRGGALVALKLPLLHAAALGLVVNQLGWGVPRPIAAPIHLLGQTVVPLMLLALGARLRDLLRGGERRELPVRPIIYLVLLRFGGGLAAALLTNAVLGNTGLTAAIVLLTGLLPPAVMSFALVEKYGEDPRAASIVSAAIAAGTAAALVVLPLAVDAARRLASP